MNNETNKEILFYSKLKLKWTFADMLLFNELNFLISDLFDKDNVGALVAIIYCGLENKDFNRALDIVSGWIKYFKNIESLRLLTCASLKDIHKFIVDNNKDDELIDVFEMLPEEEETKDREEKIYDERENLKKLMYVFFDNGYSVEETLKQDLRYFEFLNGYSINKREEKINDDLYVIHRLGMLVGIGVNSPKNYPDTMDNIRLTKKTKFEKLKELRESTRAFYNSLKED